MLAVYQVAFVGPYQSVLALEYQALTNEYMVGASEFCIEQYCIISIPIVINMQPTSADI